ncbi:MAG: S8 family serine peptidase [Actinomycetota bacterium]|nr:S8 family serine peptidase [Actinomycetota bacterium]
MKDSYIVVYKSRVSEPNARTDAHERSKGFKTAHRYRRVLGGFSARLRPGQVEALRADPDVAYVSPDLAVRATGTNAVSDGDSAPPGVRRIEAATKSAVHGQSSANVAVIDTGVDLDHPDLSVRGGANCLGSGPPEDEGGHGTHVAGTIAARNNGLGVTGVAPGTTIYAVKALDGAGNGSWASVICAIDWVTGTRGDLDPTNDIAVANMSLGGSGAPVTSCAETTDALHAAVCNATAAGVHLVAAAGNAAWDFDYAEAPDVPAAYPEVLTVTAMSDGDGTPGGVAPLACSASQTDDRYATYSSFAATAEGARHTIAAPGSCVQSTSINGTYSTLSGTSMATPHVAGALALCLGEEGAPGPCSGLSPASVIDKLRGDAQGHDAAEPGYGYDGDPSRPTAGRYYGPLAWVGIDAARDPVVVPPQLSVSDAWVVEGSAATTTARFSVSLSAPASGPVSVKVATANATAVAPGDYTALGSTTVSFAPGETTKSVEVGVNTDALREANEVFSLRLSSPSGAVVADGAGVATVVDDDGGLPQVSISDTWVAEGDAATSTARFAVSLSAPASGAVSVKVATANSTAVAPGDYTALGSTTVSFAPGETTKTVEVGVNGDALHEGNEAFVLRLFSPIGAVVSDGAGVATVVDEEGPFAVSVDDAVVVEGDDAGAVATFNLSLSATPLDGESVTVQVASANGTAVAPGDYTALGTTTVTFGPGVRTQTVRLAVAPDKVAEPNETLLLRLSSPSRGAVLADSVGTGTIVDDD